MFKSVKERRVKERKIVNKGDKMEKVTVEFPDLVEIHSSRFR